MTWVQDLEYEQAALAVKCMVCKAGPGVLCRNTIRPDRPLPGRRFHFGRLER